MIHHYIWISNMSIKSTPHFYRCLQDKWMSVKDECKMKLRLAGYNTKIILNWSVIDYALGTVSMRSKSSIIIVCTKLSYLLGVFCSEEMMIFILELHIIWRRNHVRWDIGELKLLSFINDTLDTRQWASGSLLTPLVCCRL
jgi:hypothetical protein